MFGHTASDYIMYSQLYMGSDHPVMDVDVIHDRGSRNSEKKANSMYCFLFSLRNATDQSGLIKRKKQAKTALSGVKTGKKHDQSGLIQEYSAHNKSTAT